MRKELYAYSDGDTGVCYSCLSRKEITEIENVYKDTGVMFYRPGYMKVSVRGHDRPEGRRYKVRLI